MSIGIVVDNTCNIPIEILEENNIGYVSLYVMRNNNFVKAIDVCQTTYYEDIKVADYIPQTSQPATGDFEKVFRKMLETHDQIISLNISSRLSGTVNSAQLAANLVDSNRIHVIDTKTTSWGLGFLTMKIKEMINQNYDINALKIFAKQFYKKTNIFFSVGDLNYLYKGGRIGKAKALMGGLLNLKPLITLEEGELKAMKNVRGVKRVINEIVENAMEFSGKLKSLAIIHTGNLKLSGDVLEKLDKLGIDDDKITVSYMDVIIGNHLGPDSVGLVAYYE